MPCAVTDRKPMRLAYVTTYDASDVHAWSGLGNAIAKSLDRAGFELDLISLRTPAQWRTKVMRLGWRAAATRLLVDREPFVTRGYASQVTRRLKFVEHDIVFSPGTIPIGRLNTSRPIVYWTDATFDGMVDYYESFTGLSRRSLRNGHELEQNALDRCSMALFSSEWAANSAIDHYRVDPLKVHVVPFGANISDEPSRDDVLTEIDRRDPAQCDLLFVGVDWERKGGEVAVAAVEAMIQNGMRARLHVVGCTPPRLLPNFVEVHGFISKREPAGRKRLASLYARAHFIIGPSKAECYGLVFAEACCHGVPVLASDTGGVATIVSNGVNGQLFPPGATGQVYARMALEIMRDPNEYRRLALGARHEFETRLNWSAAGAHVRQLITAQANNPN
jgi:glycosyltransferase involved in cell wall biosynthesis